MEGYPCFVVNLDRNPERWEVSQKRILEAGFKDVRRVSAVDGKNKEVLENEWKKYGSPKFAAWDKEFVEHPGKQGCFLSHLNIWSKMIEEGIERAVVLEDDVLFHPRWAELYPLYLEKTPKDVEVLYLGSQIEFHSQYHVDKGPVFCTNAMLITLEGAKKLKELVLSREVYTVDCMLIDQMKKGWDLKWVVWNAQRFYPTEMQHMPKGWTKRNCGLIFQDESFGSEVRIW